MKKGTETIESLPKPASRLIKRKLQTYCKLGQEKPRLAATNTKWLLAKLGINPGKTKRKRPSPSQNKNARRTTEQNCIKQPKRYREKRQRYAGRASRLTDQNLGIAHDYNNPKSNNKLPGGLRLQRQRRAQQQHQQLEEPLEELAGLLEEQAEPPEELEEPLELPEERLEQLPPQELEVNFACWWRLAGF